MANRGKLEQPKETVVMIGQIHIQELDSMADREQV
jgi:hypothetical protein